MIWNGNWKIYNGLPGIYIISGMATFTTVQCSGRMEVFYRIYQQSFTLSKKINHFGWNLIQNLSGKISHWGNVKKI